jgi:hypothetical protein
MRYIIVNDDWKIKVDEYNYQLVRFRKGGEEIKQGKYKGNTTKERWEELQSFHPNLQQALKRIIELDTNDMIGSDGVFLYQYVSTLNDHKNEILASNFKQVEK